MHAGEKRLVSFVSAPLVPDGTFIASSALSQGEPPVPTTFAWSAQTLRVGEVMRTWRSTTNDRGDTYLARHWYEVRLDDERIAVIYFDRHAKRGRARWWLYTIAAPSASAP